MFPRYTECGCCVGRLAGDAPVPAPQNEILKGALAATGLVAVMASEEDDDVIEVPAVRLPHRPRPLRCCRAAPARRCGLHPATGRISAVSRSHGNAGRSPADVLSVCDATVHPQSFLVPRYRLVCISCMASGQSAVQAATEFPPPITAPACRVHLKLCETIQHRAFAALPTRPLVLGTAVMERGGCQGLGCVMAQDGGAAGGGRYAVVFDPLDGSRNIECSIPTGTIFGIYSVPEGVISTLYHLFLPECASDNMESSVS